MLRLMTDKEVIQKYGDPSKFVDDDGSVSAGWQLSILDRFMLPKPLPLSWGGQATRISCHKLVKPELEAAVKKIAAIPKVWDCINDYGGCYNFRRNRNAPGRLSRHSWGIAIDLDVADNPSGGPSKMPPLIIQALYDIDWIWGGWFEHPDPMHFEKAVSF
jgi:D-alanyl-D-alanine carboxypeptidase-like protein